VAGQALFHIALAENAASWICEDCGRRGYDCSDLSAKVLAPSGLHVVWRDCRGVLAGIPETACEGEMQVNEIVMQALLQLLARQNGVRGDRVADVPFRVRATMAPRERA
jgi:hypothetical protein